MLCNSRSLSKEEDMSILKSFENYLADSEILSRRSVLGKLTRGCAVLVAALGGAGFLSEAPLALALTCNSCNAHGAACCSLCFNYCSGDSCPGGYTQYTWMCTQRTGNYNCPWVCGECYCPNQGLHGVCSFAYPLCASHCPCVPGTPSAESMMGLLPLRAAGEKCH